MSKRFSLNRSVPEPLEFEAPDGQIYEINRAKHLSSNQQQLLLRLHGRLQVAQQQLQKKQSQEQEAKASAQLLQALGDFVRLVAPKLPAEVVADMEPLEQMAFLQWWFDEQPELAQQAPAGESAAPGTPRGATPAPASKPASSAPTSQGTRRNFGKRRNGSLR